MKKTQGKHDAEKYIPPSEKYPNGAMRLIFSGQFLVIPLSEDQAKTIEQTKKLEEYEKQLEQRKSDVLLRESELAECNRTIECQKRHIAKTQEAITVLMRQIQSFQTRLSSAKRALQNHEGSLEKQETNKTRLQEGVREARQSKDELTKKIRAIKSHLEPSSSPSDQTAQKEAEASTAVAARDLPRTREPNSHEKELHHLVGMNQEGNLVIEQNHTEALVKLYRSGFTNKNRGDARKWNNQWEKILIEFFRQVFEYLEPPKDDHRQFGKFSLITILVKVCAPNEPKFSQSNTQLLKTILYIITGNLYHHKISDTGQKTVLCEAWKSINLMHKGNRRAIPTSEEITGGATEPRMPAFLDDRIKQKLSERAQSYLNCNLTQEDPDNKLGLIQHHPTFFPLLARLFPVSPKRKAHSSKSSGSKRCRKELPSRSSPAPLATASP